MTCIAAIVDKNGVGHIACDSVGSNGFSRSFYSTKKIFSVGNILFGFTGSYRLGQLLQYRLDLPQATVDQNLDQYMNIHFMDSIRSTLKDHGYLHVEDNEESLEGEFLVVFSGRIFTVQSDMSILESMDKFEATGSGEDYARATMNTLVEYGVEDTKLILTEAIETATKYVPSVGGEIHILSES
jgi:ATP-dependent protease HslVU (ClpYQ) peptidase subunit